MTHYDYSKYELGDWNDMLNTDYWGIHEVNGRVEVDVDRYVKTISNVGAYEYLPDGIKALHGLYVPSKKRALDYSVNGLVGAIRNLRADWNQEYKPLFAKIRTPAQAENDYYVNTIMFLGDSELYDDAATNAGFVGVQRSFEYNRIFRDVYCVFISKICAEVDRIILKAFADLRYENEDYSIRDFTTFCNAKKPKISVYSIKKYKTYSKLHNVNNFIKHNSVSAYKALKQYNPDCLDKEWDARHPYENGMFAIDYINLDEADIDRFLEEIEVFLKDFCKKILNEDYVRCSWDSDDFFRRAVFDVHDQKEYLGIYGSVGMGPIS